MATITKETIKTIIDEIIKTAKNESDVKNILFNHVKLTDKIPVALAPTMVKIVSHCYDKSGTGYNGVMNEIEKRIDLYSLIYDEITVKEFFLHKMGRKDLYDKENKESYELKSGCGNWLYSKNSSFLATIANYERRKEKIRWTYQFEIETKKEGKEVFNIDIDTEWKTLFSFLKDYNGHIETWFKENSKSGEFGTYIWEMQTVKTSRKKAVYLTTFEQWKKEHK